MSVVLYHAQIVIFGRDWFEGGFIGVDIFFVISGYLITRIILTEIKQTSTFSFIKFYERRARRILPMLFLVILVCLPFAMQRLMPIDLVAFSYSALSAIGFVSNLYFYFSTTEYGAGPALLMPLLHTWSLGVEEQFYIVAPIMIIFIWNFARVALLTLLVVMLLLSIQFADVMDTRNPQFNFFLPFSRFWELLVGSILAYVELRFGRSNNKLYQQTLPIIGLLLIAHSILFFNSSTPHPSFYTLIPVVGVALIIAFCSFDDLVGRILSIKPVVGVGLISYSLYLWHFPIFAFNRIDNLNPTNLDKIEWIGITAVLSGLSYFFVEKPFRISFRKPAILAALSLTTLTVTGLVMIVLHKGILTEGSETFVEINTPRSYEVRDEQNHVCSTKEVDSACSFYSDSQKIDVVVVGDSIAASLGNGFYQNLERVNLTLLTRSSCYFFPNTDFNLRNNDYPCEKDYQNKRFEYLKTLQDTVIIFSGMVDYYLSQNSYEAEIGTSSEENFINAVNQLLKKNNTIVLVYPMPIPDEDIGKALHRSITESGKKVLFAIQENIKNTTSVSYERFSNFARRGFGLLDSIKDPNVIRVFPHEIVCNKMCDFAGDTSVYILDKHHYSKVFSIGLAEEILRQVEQMNDEGNSR